MSDFCASKGAKEEEKAEASSVESTLLEWTDGAAKYLSDF